ncbi:hypothetical protein SAMN06265379_10389 [Saccharicrinis carchari]|uniref:Uncharacterized protein n=1 Tax=Saccharicrinis carchari TaxID=1168039 RepID=A0A521CFR2_SACCC|nr:hypothetical protein [Saccharicrinis carchari]SMO58205.1 hypothetical protein SAMN06265379_10389 [Saccharicrinis carchari]
MNVALIEFNNFHDECIYSQVAYIKSNTNNKVFLVCNYRLKDRIDYWDLIDDVLFVRSKQWGVGYVKILNFLRKNAVERCVFNSVHHPSVLNLLRVASRKRKYFGLMHDRSNFASKLTRRLNKYMSAYFVLNDYLLPGIETYHQSPVPVSSLYTIYYQQYKMLDMEKGENEIWVLIPGKMQNFRRDYATLLNSFVKGDLNPNIKLIFLGQSIFMRDHGQDIRKDFEQHDKNNNCIFWDAFIDKDTFHTYLSMADYLLPLIHTNHQTQIEYQNKISGTFNLALGYDKPMIMDAFFARFNDFKSNAVFYTIKDDLVTELNSLKTPDAAKKGEGSKWSFEKLSKKYLDFVLGKIEK